MQVIPLEIKARTAAPLTDQERRFIRGKLFLLPKFAAASALLGVGLVCFALKPDVWPPDVQVLLPQWLLFGFFLSVCGLIACAVQLVRRFQSVIADRESLAMSAALRTVESSRRCRSSSPQSGQRNFDCQP